MWPPPRFYRPMGPPQMPFAPYPMHPPPLAPPHPAANMMPMPGSSRAPWDRQVAAGGGESWKQAAAPPETWRSYNAASNHEFYRQQYAQLPLSRPYGQFSYNIKPESPASSGRAAVPPEYAPHVDYEKQLRDQYESPQQRNNYSDFSDASRKFEIDTEPSAKKIKLSWKLPTLPGVNDKFKISLLVKLEELEGGIGRAARSGEIGSVLVDKILPIHIRRAEFNAIPGSLYSIHLNIFNQNNVNVFTANKTERAVFSMNEMKVLMQRAINFTGTQMKPFTYLYRCKPKIYWDYIYNETGQIMHVYQKDSNGQAACPINQNIHGLFFSAKTNPDGYFPNSSPFGDVRMVLPAMTLLDPLLDRMNLYFSDFYCNRVTHYVTVVLATRNSVVDDFCKEKLLILDPFSNPFLQLQPTADPRAPRTYFVNRKVWVEIYYTEDIPMRWGRFDNIFAQGIGTSKIGGLPHNKACRTCNLYPVGIPAPQPPEEFEPLAEGQAERMVDEAIRAELVDSEGSADEFDDQNEENSTFVTYEELKRRLEQMDASLPSGEIVSENGLSSQGKSLKDLTQQVRHFMQEMRRDFDELDGRISDLHKSSLFASRKEGTSSHPQATQSQNASTANDSNQQQEGRTRVRKLSAAQAAEDVQKRQRRDSR